MKTKTVIAAEKSPETEHVAVELKQATDKIVASKASPKTSTPKPSVSKSSTSTGMNSKESSAKSSTSKTTKTASKRETDPTQVAAKTPATKGVAKTSATKTAVTRTAVATAETKAKVAPEYTGIKIAFVTAECLPFVKTGGLADVGLGLTQALSKQGHEVIVFMPKYKNIIEGTFNDKYPIEHLLHFDVHMNHQSIFCGLDSCMVGKVRYIFIDHEQFFNRETNGGYYGHGDDGYRFGFFNRAVLDAFGHLNWFPEIAHINDWHTGLLPFILNTQHRQHPDYANIKVVMTIHNLKFQGWFDNALFNDLDLHYSDSLIMGDKINFLKTGILNSAKINTVSPSYRDATLSLYAGEGLNRILKLREADYVGILNGIDETFFTPVKNPFIEFPYSSKNATTMKLNNKIALKKEFGIESDNNRPLYVVISRLTSQKGIELIIDTFDTILHEHLDLIILGDGDDYLVEKIEHAAAVYRNLNIYVGYNEALAHKLYAAADFFLMPSLFEPCGLSQLISLNFGTIPLVHDIDGLHDSIVAYNEFERTGYGLKFVGFTNEIFIGMVKYAQYLYYNHDHLTDLRKNAFACDFSFDHQVNRYIEFYQS